MFYIETEKARSFIDDSEWEQSFKEAQQASKHLENRTGKGSEWLGWQDILKNPDSNLLKKIAETGSDIYKNADVFIICGIGGSYLGARAVIEALNPDFSNDGPEIIYAGHHISGEYLQQLLKHLEKPKSDGSAKQVYLNVISKSGTTMETAIAFRVLRKWMHDQYGDEAVARIYCTTSRDGGALNKIIQAYGYRKFVLPDDIGGRYSVLTPVGLLPVSAAGIDINKLFYGAVESYRELNTNNNNVLEYIASRLALYKKGFIIDLLSTFDPALVSFGKWMQQLYGESEGKNGKGIFPSVAQYSTDLHSIGQMVQEGPRNMMETFLTVKTRESTLRLNNDPEDYDGLNYLTGKSFEEINDKAFQGTCKAHHKGGVPIFTGIMDKLNAESIGQAIYFFELSTAIFVYATGENPFDQPGVEAYKKVMYQLLGKEV